MLDQVKPWYFSRTVWASIVTVAAAVAGLAGHSIDAGMQTALADGVLQVVTAAGGIIAVLGRLAATARIG